MERTQRADMFADMCAFGEMGVVNAIEFAVILTNETNAVLFVFLHFYSTKLMRTKPRLLQGGTRLISREAGLFMFSGVVGIYNKHAFSN